MERERALQRLLERLRESEIEKESWARCRIEELERRAVEIEAEMRREARRELRKGR